MQRTALIMAGGEGSRIWPLSRKTSPKHMNTNFFERPTFKHTVDMISHLVDLDRIYVSTGPFHYRHIARSAVSKSNIILQSENRNTAPAILHCLKEIKKRNGNCTVAIMPSDQVIKDEEVLLDALEQCFISSEKEDKLIAIGTEAIYPSTNFGYLKKPSGEKGISKVLAFKEKPKYITAMEYVETGSYLFNTGIYVSTTAMLLDEYEKHMPRLFALSSSYKNMYRNAPCVSFDRGISEKTDRLYVIESTHKWLDTGTFEFIESILPKDKNGNAIKGKGLLADSRNNMLYSEGKEILAYGIEDTFVINTDDIIFVCSRKSVQRLRSLIEQLKEKGRYDIL